MPIPCAGKEVRRLSNKVLERVGDKASLPLSFVVGHRMQDKVAILEPDQISVYF